MEHIAIDLGGRESQICVRNGSGQIVEERRWPTAKLDGYLRKRAGGRVILETCAEAFWVADRAREIGYDVRVVPSMLVRALGVGARGIKTDQRDAQKLSEISVLGDLSSVHVPSQEARDRKAICVARDALVETRTKLVNVVRGLLRLQVKRLQRGSVDTFARRVRALGSVPAHIERLLLSIEQLTEQIEQADRELSTLAEKDETCKRLMTVPGVGAVTSVRFVATVDDVGRFENAHQLESYLGLTPGESSSSDRKRRTSITKAGPAKMRWCLLQAAWSCRRTRKDQPIKDWAAGVEKRRGKTIAIVALARKVAGILYALWRDGSVYDPTRGADRVPM